MSFQSKIIFCAYFYKKYNKYKGICFMFFDISIILVSANQLSLGVINGLKMNFSISAILL